MSAKLLDPYSLLEIPEDADASTIRQAFRRLAMRWHPDRNPDPLAAERFKEIRGAYERLISSPDDSDERPAGESTARSHAPRGADRHEEIWLGLEEAMLGCDKPFTIRRERDCVECDGVGRVELAHTRLCTVCHGSGRVRGSAGLEACTSCAGKGYVRLAQCAHCAGSGRTQADQGVTVHVAAGVLPGEVLRLKNLGHAGTEGGEPGTLFLTVRLKSHPLFRLEGRNLHCTQPVSALRLIAGGRLSLAGPLGPIVVELEPAQIDGRELRLAGRGFPGRGGAIEGAGDLVVELEPVMPQGLDDAQLALLAKLEAGLQGAQERHYPSLHAWWQAYRATRV